MVRIMDILDMDSPYINAVGLQKKKPPIMRNDGGRTLRHHAIMYILEGRGEYEDERTPKTGVVPGTFFYLYPGVWHNFDPYPDTTWAEYWVTFDGEAVRSLLGDLLPEERALYRADVDAKLVAAYERLYELWFYQPRGYPQTAFLLLHEILVACYVRVHSFDANPRRCILQHARPAMQACLGTGTFDVPSFAESQNMSYEKFRKEFRRASGLPPNQYFLMLKMNRAKELLLRTNKTVREVAFDLGFDDPYYFSRLFKKKVGAAPVQYKGSVRGKQMS
jgi:AraC-like DNA-binding protein